MNTYDVFVEVVKCGSFSAAAKKLHRTPSAISKQISLLEQRLNVQLVDRTTRSLTVTQAGMLYYQRCLDISERMQSAEDEIKGFSDDPKGRVKVTWPTPLTYSRIPDVLSEFSAAYPQIFVDIDVNLNLLNLSQDNIDFAFRTGPLEDSNMVAVPLFSIQPLLCAAPALLSQYGEPKNIESLSTFPLIVQSNINTLQKVRSQYPQLKSLIQKETHASNDLLSILRLVKSGIGAAFLFRHMIEEELSSGDLIHILPDLELPKLPVHLMYHKVDYTPKRLQCFLDFFKSAFA